MDWMTSAAENSSFWNDVIFHEDFFDFDFEFVFDFVFVLCFLKDLALIMAAAAKIREVINRPRAKISLKE